MNDPRIEALNRQAADLMRDGLCVKHIDERIKQLERHADDDTDPDEPNSGVLAA